MLAGPLATSAHHLKKLAAAVDPVEAVLKTTLSAALEPNAILRPREILGQLLLGELAERAFVDIYRSSMGSAELRLEDERTERSDTDYRVLDAQRRPVFRINIKFFGTPFRKAPELVALEPEDCFALATYKIYQGLVKQDAEALPYVFMIVGVPGLTGAVAADAIPERFAHLAALVHLAKNLPGKRSVEERIVAHILDKSADADLRAALQRFADRIATASWYALSARRADNLLKEMLFDRVYGVRVRAFARNYGRAELDMHFSLSKDLTPLSSLLARARERGLHGLAVELERGVM